MTDKTLFQFGWLPGYKYLVKLVANTLGSGGSRNFERGVQQVSWHIHTIAHRLRAAKRRNFFYVFFLAIRKHSHSISAHSGHVPRCKED